MTGLFDSGYWTPGRILGVPVRLHWTIPVGALFFGGFAIVPGFWLGFVLLVLIHELGHAFLVRRRGLHNQEIRIHGLGGVSLHEAGSPYDRAIIAWGGVLAQMLVLYLPALLIVTFVPLPASAFLAQLFGAFLTTNLLLAAFNLIPIAPFDGAWAWKLPGLWSRRRRADRQSRGGRRHVAPAPPPKDPPRAGSATSAKEIARRALEDARGDD